MVVADLDFCDVIRPTCRAMSAKLDPSAALEKVFPNACHIREAEAGKFERPRDVFRHGSRRITYCCNNSPVQHLKVESEDAGERKNEERDDVEAQTRHFDEDGWRSLEIVENSGPFAG